ncbi:MAG: amidohydrolase [Dehalococcoidia bacterium]
MPSDPDIIFTGGPVHTVDAGNTIAEAVAVADGRVLAVGGTSEIRALKGSGTRVVELEGRALLPGFIDGHAHFPFTGAAAGAVDCKAPGMQSISALQEAVRERAAKQPPGTWIRGRGYDQTRLAEGRQPNRFDWDPVAPDHPVIFTRTCGHICSVNSKALELAGLSDQEPDPDGGRYERADGRITGVCFERAQMPIQRVSALSREELREALLTANDLYLAAGGTSVHDAGGLVGPPFQPCQDLVDEGRIKVRLYGFTTVNSHEHPLVPMLNSGLHTGFGDARLRLGAFKVMTDGSSSGPTAATREPYTSNSDDFGILYWSQDDLDDLLGRAHRQGFQCTVHAVGDKAIEQTLNALARAQSEFPREGLRHRIDHCGICPPDLRQRVKEQGIVPSMQPAFFWEFGDGYIANYGQHRADTMFPARSLIEAGVVVAGGSDSPVTDFAPLFGIEQAMTRATSGGQVCGPDEKVDLTTAIRMHTINGAYASFEEDIKGSIEPGKLADLVVLGEDISRVTAAEVRQIPVAMTLVGGEVAYEAAP